MKIIFCRHAEPDYEHDSITDKGKIEAELLARRLCRIDIDEIYVSPLGRARRTAEYTLEKTGKTAETFKWLREFDGKVKENGEIKGCWDKLPEYWTAQDEYYSADKWLTTPLMKIGTAKREYEFVCNGIDKFLAEHGYKRNGRYYDVTNSNHKTIVFFCHFGVECAILSRIFGVSPMPLWHNFVALPSSVTTIVSEERVKGKAQFRCMEFGDTSHLYAAGEEPSFAARFCECFEDNTRHD